MFGYAPEWFGVVLWLSPHWITCSGGNSSISIFGSGSKWLFVVFTTFFGIGGYEKKFFSSGPQLCMLKKHS